VPGGGFRADDRSPALRGRPAEDLGGSELEVRTPTVAGRAIIGRYTEVEVALGAVPGRVALLFPVQAKGAAGLLGLAVAAGIDAQIVAIVRRWRCWRMGIVQLGDHARNASERRRRAEASTIASAAQIFENKCGRHAVEKRYEAHVRVGMVSGNMHDTSLASTCPPHTCP